MSSMEKSIFSENGELRRENKMLSEELSDLERDYHEVCKEHSDAILRAAQAEKDVGNLRQDLSDLEASYNKLDYKLYQAERYTDNLIRDLTESQRNFEFIDGELTEVLNDVDDLSRQVLGHEYEGRQTFEELSKSFDELGEYVVGSHREIERLEGEREAMDEELREMTVKYRQATLSKPQPAVYHREDYEAIIEDLTEEKRLLHKEIARLNEELAVAIGVKDDDYAEEYRKMTVEFAKEHREVRELRGLLSDIHRLSDIEV